MNYSYLYYFSTKEYLSGFLASVKSLKATGTSIMISVLVTEDIYDKALKNLLDSLDLNVIVINNTIIPNNIININTQSNRQHWSNTFNKLKMFDLVHQGISKFVYLDCDTFIRKNIDHLFGSNSISAVIAGGKYPGNVDWTDFNSGVMVFEPDHEFFELLQNKLKEFTLCEKSVGDQDILNACLPTWSCDSSKMLNDCYNMFFNHIEFYTDELGYDINDICIIHFIGKDKPWFDSKVKRFLRLVKYILVGQFDKAKIYKEYLKLLEVDIE